MTGSEPPMTPSAPPPGAALGNSYGLVFGLLGGLVAGFAVSLLSMLNGFMACAHDVALGVGELGVIAGLLALAWYLLFRVKALSFTLGLLRGLALGLVVPMIIPWPCSLGWQGVASLVCR
jgi:membrane associated rhomboid family serine protease